MGVTGQNGTPLVEVRDLKMHFPITRGIVFQRQVGAVKAVDGVSFHLKRGETLGLVGESGSGKTTIGRTTLRLNQPTSGEIRIDGKDIATAPEATVRRLRPRMQMIFQDPYACLNPRLTVGTIIAEAAVHHGILKKRDRQSRVGELLETVGLDPAFAQRYPHEFSGGQRQRIGIARALALSPDFIVCDEPIAALDVSIQAQVINLLKTLQGRLGLTYLFIAHDLSVVRHISDRIAVMYLGKIVEMADSRTLYHAPKHPYSKALLSAVPIPDPRLEKKRSRIMLTGDLPSPANPPKGCNFCTRCPIADEICRKEEPPLIDHGNGHQVACHFATPAVSG